MPLDMRDGVAVLAADDVLFLTVLAVAALCCSIALTGLPPCRYVVVDEFSKTSVENIYAVGDITDRMALTPVALLEGMCLAKTLFNDQPIKPDHKNIPTAVFSQPHIGTVGYGEEEAVEKFGDIDVYSSSYRPMRNTISGNESRGFMKILVDASNDKVVGIHIVGPEAGEMMQVCMREHRMP